MGHGWGLPHTDEDYYNPNRGDCLDLTLNPDGDVQPGSYNFNLLTELYGSADGSINATRTTNATSSGTTNYGGSSRRLTTQKEPRQGFLRRLDTSTPSSHRALIETRYQSAVKAFEQGNLCHKLTGSKTGCAIDLGHGYTLDAHIFPVQL
jgi:hypothetical protein